MTFLSRGQTVQGWSRPADKLNAFTVVCFDPVAMEEKLDFEFNEPDAPADIYFQDTGLAATMRKLAELLPDEGANHKRIYLETVGLTAALEMFHLLQTTVKRIPASGELSQWQVRTILDYMDGNLGRDLNLEEMAATCSLSRFHFSRTFKKTFGAPPCRYLLMKRIELAKQMLHQSQFAIADIAAACGFNGLTQFGRSFRELVGVTPVEFRRGL